jgi:hypothetical protein
LVDRRRDSHYSVSNRPWPEEDLVLIRQFSRRPRRGVAICYGKGETD